MNHQDSFTASKKMCSLAKQFFGYETSKGLIKKIQVHVIEEVEQGPRGLQSLSHGALRLKSFGFGARSLTQIFIYHGSFCENEREKQQQGQIP